jgi:hypothetical protein
MFWGFGYGHEGQLDVSLFLHGDVDDFDATHAASAIFVGAECAVVELVLDFFVALFAFVAVWSEGEFFLFQKHVDAKFAATVFPACGVARAGFPNVRGDYLVELFLAFGADHFNEFLS